MTKNHKPDHPWDRLDLWAVEALSLTRSQAQKWIENGHILVNEAPSKSSQKLSENDVINVTAPPDTLIQDPSEKLPPLDLVYEDDDILVLNKPAGIVVHPVNFSQTGTLVHQLKAYGCPLSTSTGALRPGIVHRLDRDTEGLMMIAKTNEAHHALKKQFQDHQVEKHYYTVVKGDFSDDELTLTNFIGRHPKKRKLRSVVSEETSDAKTATTFFKVLRRYTTKTWLTVTPLTGRTHQIRVHLAHLGYPILGDPEYGPKPNQGKGQLLQAYSLSFTHPTTGERLSFKLPISERLRISTLKDHD